MNNTVRHLVIKFYNSSGNIFTLTIAININRRYFHENNTFSNKNLKQTVVFFTKSEIL